MKIILSTLLLILSSANVIFAGTSVLSYPYPPLITADVVDTKPYPPAVLVEKIQSEKHPTDTPEIDVRDLDSTLYPPAIPVKVDKPLIPVVPVVTEVSKPYPAAAPVEVVKPVIVESYENPSKPYPAPISTQVLTEYYSVDAPAIPQIVIQPTHPYPAPDSPAIVPIVTEYHFNVDVTEESKPYPPAVPVGEVQSAILENAEELKPYPPAVLTPIVTEYHYSVDAEEVKPAISVNVVETKPYPPAVPAEENNDAEYLDDKPYPPAVPVEVVEPNLVPVVPIVTQYEYNVGVSDVPKPYPAAVVVTEEPGEILPVNDLKPYPPAVEVVEPNLVPIVPVVTEYEYNVGASDVSKPYAAAVIVSEEPGEILSVSDLKPYPAAVPVEVVEPNLVPIVPVVTEYEYNVGGSDVSKPYAAAVVVSEEPAEILTASDVKPYPAAVPVEVVEPNLVPIAPVLTEYTYNVGALEVSKPYPVAALVSEEPVQTLVTDLKPYPPAVPIQTVQSPVLTTHQLLTKPYPPPLY